MRRAGLVVVAVVLLVVVARLTVGGTDRTRTVPGPAGAADPGVAADPETAARRAHALAQRAPLLVRLVDVNGVEVARARLGGERAELAAGGLSGVQDGTRLTALGTTVEVAAADPQAMLAPLVERPARWEDGHLRLEGTPPAVAWLDAEGHLTSLELELAAGRLVVTPAPTATGP